MHNVKVVIDVSFFIPNPDCLNDFQLLFIRNYEYNGKTSAKFQLIAQLELMRSKFVSIQQNECYFDAKMTADLTS